MSLCYLSFEKHCFWEPLVYPPRNHRGPLGAKVEPDARWIA